MIDKLAALTVDQLKAMLVIEQSRLEYFGETTVTFGDEPDFTIDTTITTNITQWGSWESHKTTLEYQLKDDWYNTVFLKGIPTVRYNNATNLVLDVLEVLPEEAMKPHFRNIGLTPYRIKIAKFIPPTHTYNRANMNFDRTPASSEIIERYMVACPTGDAIVCFAGIHINAAASNCKRSVMKMMKQAMSL